MNRALGAPSLAAARALGGGGGRRPTSAELARRPRVDLDEEDLALLARSGATVVLCPRSNLHIGGKLADLPRLLAAGIPLAVGTDSLASSPSLAPLAELAALLRGFPADRPGAPPRARLERRRRSARPRVGRLAPGTRAGRARGAAPRGAADDPARWLLEVFGDEERAFEWVARHVPAGEPRMTVAALSRMVKFEHSLFALPFAASAAVLVRPRARLEPLRLALVALAVVAARTAAMAMNRLADRAFDARNPRTLRRELVTGEVSLRAAWALLAGSSLTFAAVAWAISPLCGALALPVLAILLGYSYAKRFTWACHLWLGVAQALGPDRRRHRAHRRARPHRADRARARGRRLGGRLRRALRAAGPGLRPRRPAPLHPGPLRRPRRAPLGAAPPPVRGA